MNDAMTKLQQEITALAETACAPLASEIDEGVEPPADRKEAVNAAVDELIDRVMKAVGPWAEWPEAFVGGEVPEALFDETSAAVSDAANWLEDPAYQAAGIWVGTLSTCTTRSSERSPPRSSRGEAPAVGRRRAVEPPMLARLQPAYRVPAQPTSCTFSAHLFPPGVDLTPGSARD